MQIGDPLPSQYDWRFEIFGFRTRVTWLFWAVAAALGYSRAVSLNAQYSMYSMDSAEITTPGVGVLLLVWAAVMFVSILVHELGHAFAFRYFGIQSEIVLYHMGGLAIPTQGFLWGRQGSRRSLGHWEQLLISLAGPVAQIALALIVGFVAIGCGIRVPLFVGVGSYLGLDLSHVTIARSAIVYGAIDFCVTASIFWAVLNLLPVYPLDGGQIAQHLIGWYRRTDGQREAYMVGVIVGFAVALWMWNRGSTISAVFFASMAMSNLQALQGGNGPRIW